MTDIKPDNVGEPVVFRIVDRSDVSYIVDALINDAERRRTSGGRLQEMIADHLEDLAFRLHGGDYRIDGIEVVQR